MFDLQKMMKQAQKMQDQMKDVQEEMEQAQFTGSAGNGAVVISCNGKYEFTAVRLNGEAMADKDMLEDLILIALKDINGQVTDAMEQKMSKITSGLNIPGLSGLKIPGF